MCDICGILQIFLKKNLFRSVHRRLSFRPEWKTARRMASLWFKPTSFICRVSLYHAPKSPAEIVFGQVIAAASRHAPSSRRAAIAGGPSVEYFRSSSARVPDRSPEVPSSFNAHARRSTRNRTRSFALYLPICAAIFCIFRFIFSVFCG